MSLTFILCKQAPLPRRHNAAHLVPPNQPSKPRNHRGTPPCPGREMDPLVGNTPDPRLSLWGQARVLTHRSSGQLVLSQSQTKAFPNPSAATDSQTRGPRWPLLYQPNFLQIKSCCPSTSPRRQGFSPLRSRPCAAKEVNFRCRSLPATLSRPAECVSSGERRRRRRRRRDGSSSPAAFSYDSCCSASWQLWVLPAKEQLKQGEIT